MSPEPVSENHGLRAGSHTVSVNGLTQSYHVAGEGPVCVVHPGGPGVDWSYLRLPKLEQFLTLVYVEPIGTGGSARLDAPEYTITRYVDQLHGLIDHLDVAPTFVLGHSHGGFVALTLAASHPHTTKGLILTSTAARTDHEWLRDVMAAITSFTEAHRDRPEIGDILAALDEEATASTDDTLTSVFRRQFPIYVADYWQRETELRPLRDSAAMFAGPNQATGHGYDLRDRLPSIDTPVLVIAGRHDRIMPLQYAEELTATLQNSQLVVLDHSAHFGHVEEPDAFAVAAHAFVHDRLAS